MVAAADADDYRNGTGGQVEGLGQAFGFVLRVVAGMQKPAAGIMANAKGWRSAACRERFYTGRGFRSRQQGGGFRKSFFKQTSVAITHAVIIT